MQDGAKITNHVIITNATLTGYCKCFKCCGQHAKGITADGHKPKENWTIAASRQIPFGSTVQFQNHLYQVQDRLAKCYDSRFDIYFESHEKAKQFGIKKNQKVVVIIR